MGVLEWLREHRIPIDAVAGTSIGGLVGGSYAVGMTEAEIRSLAEALDWDGILASDAPFDAKTFRRKQDRRAFPASMQFGVRRGLYLPRSLNNGQRIALMFDRVTLPYSALASFDELPVPFRCVAFDINRAESVVLDHGVLAEAMRATMAIPGVFLPVTIDGRLLVDGGFQNNVPADIVRQMNVDVVIAVDVGRNPSAREDVSAISMVGRAIDAVMTSGTRRSLESADLVITPDLSDLTSLDWNKASVLRERGYRAAEANAGRLLPYAMSAADYDAHEAARRARRRTAPVVPSMLVVNGLEPGDRETLTKQIRTRPGRAVDVDRLTEDLLRLSGTDRYELLTFHLSTAPGGLQLVINATPRPNGPAFLTLGVELNNVDASNFAANVSGRTTIYDAVGRGSEVRLDFVVGTRLGAAAELYRPFLARWLFAAPRVGVSHGTRNLFVDDAQVAEDGSTRSVAGFDIGVRPEGRPSCGSARRWPRTTSRCAWAAPCCRKCPGGNARCRRSSPSTARTTRWCRRRARSPVTVSPFPGDVGGRWPEGSRRRHRAPRAVRPGGGRSHGLLLPIAAEPALRAAGRRHVVRRAPVLQRLLARRPVQDVGVPERRTPRRPLRPGQRRLHAAAPETACVGGRPRVPGGVGRGGVGVRRPRHGRVAHRHRRRGDCRLADGPIFAGGSAGPHGHHRLYVALGPLFR